MFMDNKTQYCQDVSSSQLDPYIQHNKNPRKLFCGYPQTDSKVYTERPKTQKNQNYIEREEQSWQT